MFQPNKANDGGSNYIPFMGFPPIMTDVPTNASPAGPAGYKANALNSSYMNFSGNTNSITDMQSISYSREMTQGGSMPGSASVVQVNSPGCFDGGMFRHVPAPPTAMLRRTMDGDQLGASAGRRLDSSLSFSASASYVPVSAQQWSYIAPPTAGATTTTTSANAGTAVDGAPNNAPYLYTTNVPSNGVLVRMLDSAGNAVWCIQSDYNSNTTNVPSPPQPQQHQQPHPFPLPPPPPPVHRQQPQPQPSVAVTSPLQTSALESAAAAQVAQAAEKTSPLTWTLNGSQSAASPEAQPTRGTSSPPTEGDTDDYEYEPYNANTLANRRVGSLDRVRCKVHGKERSAQNMVMVRSKATNEVHWRCKRSSQCKVRTLDGDDTPLSSKESTLRSTLAEALLSPTSDGAASVPLNTLPAPSATAWPRQPPAPPQYTLVSPTNGALQLDGSFHSMSQPMQAFSTDYAPSSAHMVTLPTALTAQARPSYAAGPTYYSVFTPEAPQGPVTLSSPPQQRTPPLPYQQPQPQLPQQLSPPQQPQPAQPNNIVTVNGVAYRIVQVDGPATQLR